MRALAREQRFGQAQALLDRYLRAYPANARAQLLMAEITTESTNSHPDVALLHLRTIRPDSPKQAALVQLFKGKAYYHLGRYDQAEMSWKESMQLDPIVPESGWALVDLLDKEGRAEEAHRLGMRIHEIETDPQDRVRILLEMSRLDIETPDPLSQVELFEPLVKQNPDHLPLNLMLGQALIRVNRSDDGLKLLEDTLRHHPRSPETWDAWLNGLYYASEADKMAQRIRSNTQRYGCDPRFAKHQGMIAQICQDWPLAVQAYDRAFAFEPFNWGVCYRLRFVLRQAGKTAEYERINRLYGPTKPRTRRCGALTSKSPSRKSPPPSRERTSIKQRGAYYETLSIKSRPHATSQVVPATG